MAAVPPYVFRPMTTADLPLAYIQCYDLSNWDSGFGTHPARTRGIDQFIGEPDRIDRGHGSAFIGANAKLKAGFEKARLVDTPDGIALLMVRDA